MDSLNTVTRACERGVRASGWGKATGGILTIYPMDGCGVRKDDGEGQYKGRSLL
jgi:hypothetical protein